MSLSKNQIKLINSLRQKKYRKINNLFLAEGVKVINELINSSLKVDSIFAVKGFKSENCSSDRITYISDTDLKKISSLKKPNKVLGIFHIPEKKTPDNKGLIIALDTINNPGNFGTIIRLCDWFGIAQLICSEDTIDCYNQKVIQATMGSVTRVNILYTNLYKYIKEVKKPVFIADMEGANVYKTELPKEAVLVLGNEANGVSGEIRELIDCKLTIPRFGTVQKTESLNVATATSILISEFKRNLE